MHRGDTFATARRVRTPGLMEHDPWIGPWGLWGPWGMTPWTLGTGCGLLGLRGLPSGSQDGVHIDQSVHRNGPGFRQKRGGAGSRLFAIADRLQRKGPEEKNTGVKGLMCRFTPVVEGVIPLCVAGGHGAGFIRGWCRRRRRCWCSRPVSAGTSLPLPVPGR